MGSEMCIRDSICSGRTTNLLSAVLRRSFMLLLVQSSCQRVKLLLELRDSTVRLLLPLPAWLSNDALPIRLGASLAWYVRVRRILITAYLQPSACLASPWALRVVAIVGVTATAAFLIRTRCFINGCLLVRRDLLRTGLVTNRA